MRCRIVNAWSRLLRYHFAHYARKSQLHWLWVRTCLREMHNYMYLFLYRCICALDIFFRQIKTFRRFCLAFVFELQIQRLNEILWTIWFEEKIHLMYLCGFSSSKNISNFEAFYYLGHLIKQENFFLKSVTF